MTLLRLEGATKHFDVRDARGGRRTVQAVTDVDLAIGKGETLSIVGESGCGKSTVGRLAVRLLEPTRGRVLFEGEDISGWSRRRLRGVRRSLQIVFQDPFSSLNPRMRMRDLVAEPMRVHGLARGQALTRRVDELIERIGLDPAHGSRYPHQFSGGQRQRIGIARALAVSPKVLVLDEPVSALDVSIQAQIVNLLSDLQDELELSYVFISHDLSVVRHVSTRVAVMYLGRVVETGGAEEVFTAPAHPYTQALLSAVPSRHLPPERRRTRILIPGEVPDPASPPSGCAFRLRCSRAQDDCAVELPRLQVRPGFAHEVACHHPAPFDEAAQQTHQAHQTHRMPEPPTPAWATSSHPQEERPQP